MLAVSNEKPWRRFAVSGRSVMGGKFHAATVAAKAFRDSPLSRVKRDCVVCDAFA
jgi:hypothetical protein